MSRCPRIASISLLTMCTAPCFCMICSRLRSWFDQAFSRSLFQLVEAHAIVKEGLVGGNARLIERTLSVLQLEQTCGALAIGYASDAKRFFRSGQRLRGIDLEDLATCLIGLV